MAKTTKIKICPFFKGQCPQAKCEIYEPKLNRCTIPVLAYNLYRLSEIESRLLDHNNGILEQVELPEKQVQPPSMDLEDLFG